MITATNSSSSTDLESRNWLELPDDVTAKILQKLTPVDILDSAQMVCRSWHRVSKDPSMWRRIDMSDLGWGKHLQVICGDAVDRSDGQLNEISIGEFGYDALLEYITNRSSGLKCLRLVSCCISDDGLIKALEKLPLLEELELTYRNLFYSKKVMEAVGKSCRLLNSFKFNKGYIFRYGPCDDEALAIAENMSGLRHLQLVGNSMSDNGLRAILNGCSHLESLDLRQCVHLRLEGNLEKTCIDRVKSLKLPNASLDDYLYADVFYDHLEEDYSDYDVDVFENYYDDDFGDYMYEY